MPTETLASLLPGNTPESGTQAFRGLSTSGRTFWIKVPNQSQGPRVLATEQIVTAVGHLINAPVRETALIEIGPDWAGYRAAPGLVLEECIAHASLELEHAEERRKQAYMRNDDNARRWARWVALWDWCFGEDEQWLYAHDTDRSMWSFDHNMWIHAEMDWDASSCNGTSTQPWLWRGEWKGLDSAELHRVADILDEIERKALTCACYSIPSQWAVPQADLDALVDMLFQRKAGVAARLRVNATRAA